MKVELRQWLETRRLQLLGIAMLLLAIAVWVKAEHWLTRAEQAHAKAKALDAWMTAQERQVRSASEGSSAAPPRVPADALMSTISEQAQKASVALQRVEPTASAVRVWGTAPALAAVVDLLVAARDMGIQVDKLELGSGPDGALTLAATFQVPAK